MLKCGPYGVVNVPCNPQLLLHSLLCTIVLLLHTSVHCSMCCIGILICIHALCLMQCVSCIGETECMNALYNNVWLTCVTVCS